jgi:hypothetical protein
MTNPGPQPTSRAVDRFGVLRTICPMIQDHDSRSQDSCLLNWASEAVELIFLPHMRGQAD